jgi:hypothetical protein
MGFAESANQFCSFLSFPDDDVSVVINYRAEKAG